MNWSVFELDTNEIELLNNGLNFALPHQAVPLKELIVDSEIALNKIEADKSDNVRNHIKDILYSAPKSNENSSKLYETVKSLNKKDIYITKADKGYVGIVILKKEDYGWAWKNWSKNETMYESKIH